MDEAWDAGVRLCQPLHRLAETRMEAYTRKPSCLDEVELHLPGRGRDQITVASCLVACNEFNFAALPDNCAAKAGGYAGWPACRFGNAGNGVDYAHAVLLDDVGIDWP
jgi:hypothetical protein